MAVKKISYLEVDVLCHSWDIIMAFDTKLTCMNPVTAVWKNLRWDKRKYSIKV